MQAETMKAIEAVKAYKKRIETDTGALYKKYITDKEGAKKHLGETDKDMKLLAQILAHMEAMGEVAAAYAQACQGFSGGNQSMISTNRVMLDTIKKRVAEAKKEK